MPRRLPCLAVLLAAVLAGSPVLAQAPGAMPHGAMQHGAMPSGAMPSGAMPSGAMPSGATPPGTAPAPANHNDHADMTAAMDRMNRDMMAPGAMTGDPDRDLVAMMLPHHQGAIDMARIYLRTGRDPAIRRMAQKIITDQEREIREMRAWQARHPAPAR